jgi:FKBP-type peptidyl-prolyl cis-trans isomerase SlyD
MNIAKDTAVTLLVQINDAEGKPLDNSGQPMAYLHGGYDNIFPKIEAALEGQAVGFAADIALDAADAFGEFDATLIQTIAKKDFPPGVKVGGQLRGHDAQGREQVYTVVKIKGDAVHLDGNHALAGKALRFKLKVTDVRAASSEEITHRHVHGAHGHHH